MRRPRASGSRRNAASAPRGLMWACLLAGLMRYPCVLALLAVSAAPAMTRAATYPAAAVKAVFLYRFAGYVQWPPSVRAAPRFTIAVLQAPEVAAQLAQLLPEHLVHGKPVQLRTIQSASQLGDAQVLYVGPDYGGDLRALIGALRDQPVLIVTDSRAGLSAGGAINFLIDNEHVRFEVSTVAARRARLEISSDLLAVAKRVETGGPVLPPLCRPLRIRYSWSCLRVAHRGQPERG